MKNAARWLCLAALALFLGCSLAVFDRPLRKLEAGRVSEAIAGFERRVQQDKANDRDYFHLAAAYRTRTMPLEEHGRSRQLLETLVVRFPDSVYCETARRMLALSDQVTEKQAKLDTVSAELDRVGRARAELEQRLRTFAQAAGEREIEVAALLAEQLRLQKLLSSRSQRMVALEEERTGLEEELREIKAIDLRPPLR